MRRPGGRLPSGRGPCLSAAERRSPHAAPDADRRSDELLERLVPMVRAGVADTEPWPLDDPSRSTQTAPNANGNGCAASGQPRPGEPGFVAAVLRRHGRRRTGRHAGPHRQELHAVRHGVQLLVAGPRPPRTGTRQGNAGGDPGAGLRRAWRTRTRQRRLRRQRSVQPHFPWPGLRTERHGLGHAPRRAPRGSSAGSSPGTRGNGSAGTTSS